MNIWPRQLVSFFSSNCRGQIFISQNPDTFMKSGVPTPWAIIFPKLGLPVMWFFTQVIHAHQRDQNTTSPCATCKMDWLILLLSPFVIVFIYPVIFLITMYGGAVFLHVYRHRRRQIYDAYADNFWDGGQQTIAAVFDAHGTLWHGKWFVLFCFWFRKL